MMVVVPMDQVMYEEFMMEVSYAKLLPFIMEDFISRADAKQMMSVSNLLVSTNVSNTPTACSVAAVTFVGVTAPGVGTGTGKVTAVYTGDIQIPQDKVLLAKAEATVVSGGSGIDALVEL